jgi:hypothetical protein
MAKKPRTPDPPRKVQAPKVRSKQAQKSGFTMPGTNVVIGAGLLAIGVLVVVLFVVLSGSKGGGDVTDNDVKKVTETMMAAGCTFKGSAATGSSRHMGDPNQDVTYKTFPPANGVQNATPAIWGNYRLPADPRQVLHNLEHGGMAVWYGPGISLADRGSLDAFYADDPNGVVITPLADSYPRVTYPKHEPLGSKIALSVWTAKKSGATVYVAVCPHYDEKAFTAFRNAFRGKGPERVPLSQETPGS